MNDTINYCAILETPTKAPASSVSSSFTKSSSKDNETTRRGILFSVENLVNAAGKGQTYSGHKQNDEARPNCLSFSKTPLNELLKMKENLMKENVAEAIVPMSQPTPSRSDICGKNAATVKNFVDSVEE